jgi:hypothetical protein
VSEEGRPLPAGRGLDFTVSDWNISDWLVNAPRRGEAGAEVNNDLVDAMKRLRREDAELL